MQRPFTKREPHSETVLASCIDGTVRPICRPKQHQRVVYNGHKRVHSLKFQCVALPNGIIAHIFGPVGKFLNVVIHLILFLAKFMAAISNLDILNVTEGKNMMQGYSPIQISYTS